MATETNFVSVKEIKYIFIYLKIDIVLTWILPKAWRLIQSLPEYFLEYS